MRLTLPGANMRLVRKLASPVCAAGLVFLLAACQVQKSLSATEASQIALNVATSLAASARSKAKTGEVGHCSTITIGFDASNGISVDNLICYVNDKESIAWQTDASLNDNDFAIQFEVSPFKSGDKTITPQTMASEVIKQPAGSKLRISRYSILYKGQSLDPHIIIGGGN